MTAPQQPHPLRCGTCSKYEGDSKERYGCCKDNGEQITKLTYLFTEFHGCASHSAASQQPPAPAASQQRIEQKFGSTDLLLLAHDEWKRRVERKHLHPEPAWVSGFINGFCTDKKWARSYLDDLLKKRADEYPDGYQDQEMANGQTGEQHE